MARRYSQARRASRRASTAMEFALVAPMLVLLLVGMVEAGVQFG
ncbi:MAG: pilus assembly protein, partial [Acetobacteraceae bacterium]|nr:pilus assembly protein [Acetobacteraceae bacterium]